MIIDISGDYLTFNLAWLLFPLIPVVGILAAAYIVKNPDAKAGLSGIAFVLFIVGFLGTAVVGNSEIVDSRNEAVSRSLSNLPKYTDWYKTTEGTYVGIKPDTTSEEFTVQQLDNGDTYLVSPVS